MKFVLRLIAIALTNAAGTFMLLVFSVVHFPALIIYLVAEGTMKLKSRSKECAKAATV